MSMAGSFPEKDWKYLRSISDEMLNILCGRINREVIEIVQSQDASEHAKYLRLYKHVQESDNVVADCFNDWRRSTLGRRLLSLLRHGLLTEEQQAGLTL